MSKTIFTIVLLTSVVLLSACSKKIAVSEKPDWIDNPGNNVVGQCATHVRGLIAQEQCAYKKGLAFIAMSKGVTVDISSTMTIKQTSTEKTGRSYGKLQADVQLDEKNIKVKASIIDKWHNKVSDILYVLIKETK